MLSWSHSYHATRLSGSHYQRWDCRWSTGSWVTRSGASTAFPVARVFLFPLPWRLGSHHSLPIQPRLSCSFVNGNWKLTHLSFSCRFELLIRLFWFRAASCSTRDNQSYERDNLNVRMLYVIVVAARVAGLHLQLSCTSGGTPSGITLPRPRTSWWLGKEGRESQNH